MADRGGERVERRLAAILAADVAGYSRLAERDEEGTVARLKAHRRELFDPALAEHRGRLVKTTGDGMLVEFASAVDALRCALAVQRGMAERNAATPADRRIEFRIGINSGDMIVDGDDVLGDGVNVAARLEALAEPGGICVSGRVREDAAGKVEVAFEDAGEQRLKNIERAVRVYRVRAGGGAAALDAGAAAAPADAPPALPDRPSIAVLPFQNMSGDPEQEYFADGMVEDITTALSRTRWLFVIARNSSFTYKGRAVDVKQIGRELGVRYVLEGSVRKAGERVRITAQLIDAATGVHLWADRFDGVLADVFDLQDQVTASVAGAIRPELERAEAERARRKPTENLVAYDLYLRALPGVEGGTREAVDEALKLLDRAIELDANFAAAHAMAGRCCLMRWTNGWSVDRAREAAATVRLARRAAALGRDDALVLAHSGVALSRVGEFEHGEEIVDRALEIDPHLAVGWLYGGMLRVYAGKPDEAIERLTRAMRLSPRDPRLHAMISGIALAHFVAARYDDAVVCAERSIRENQNYLAAYRVAVASHAAAGRADEARRALARLLAVQPGCRLSLLRETVPLRRPGDLERYLGALRLAGLPE